eukprot:COSAG02_NODE_6175_length_3750_cov_22.678992_6_plen_260_part_01
MVTQAKSQMRREEMWRERWARIAVPDRALTIGTLRYAHIRTPDAEVLNTEAQEAVSRSHNAINRLHRVGNLVRLGVRMMHPGASDTHGSSSMAATQRQVDAAVEADEYASSDQGGGVWAEFVGAFFERHQDIAKLFDEFKTAYVSDRDPNYAAWQPLASRFAALEYRMARIQAKVDDDDTPQLPTGQETQAAVDKHHAARLEGANSSKLSGSADKVHPIGSGVAPLPMALNDPLRQTEGVDMMNATTPESPLSEMIERLL